MSTSKVVLLKDVDKHKNLKLQVCFSDEEVTKVEKEFKDMVPGLLTQGIKAEVFLLERV